MSTRVTVTRLPWCDLHGSEQVLAAYDGKTTSGPWAYMCESCFAEHGIGLGLGRGQQLVLESWSGPVLQNRCVHCKREQSPRYIVAVSLGYAGCAWCKQTAPVYTNVERYREALRCPATGA